MKYGSDAANMLQMAIACQKIDVFQQVGNPGQAKNQIKLNGYHERVACK